MPALRRRRPARPLGGPRATDAERDRCIQQGDQHFEGGRWTDAEKAYRRRTASGPTIPPCSASSVRRCIGSNGRPKPRPCTRARSSSNPVISSSSSGTRARSAPKAASPTRRPNTREFCKASDRIPGALGRGADARLGGRVPRGGAVLRAPARGARRQRRGHAGLASALGVERSVRPRHAGLRGVSRPTQATRGEARHGTRVRLAGQFRQGAAAYEDLLRESPNDRILLVDYAKMLAWSEEYKRAVAIYERVLKATRNTEARLGLARAGGVGRRSGACRETLRRDPGRSTRESAAVMGKIQVLHWGGRPLGARTSAGEAGQPRRRRPAPADDTAKPRRAPTGSSTLETPRLRDAALPPRRDAALTPPDIHPSRPHGGTPQSVWYVACCSRSGTRGAWTSDVQARRNMSRAKTIVLADADHESRSPSRCSSRTRAIASSSRATATRRSRCRRHARSRPARNPLPRPQRLPGVPRHQGRCATAPRRCSSSPPRRSRAIVSGRSASVPTASSPSRSIPPICCARSALCCSGRDAPAR